MAVAPAPARASKALRIARYVAAGLVLALVVFIAVRVLQGELSVTTLRADVARFGPGAPLAFVILIAITMPLLVPTTPFVLASGLLFGPWVGTLVGVLGQAIGVLASYALGRFLGVRSPEGRFGPRVERWLTWGRRRGMWGIAAMQATPLVPRKILNYALPAAGFRVWQVGLGAAIGFAPLTFLVVLTGDALFTVDALRRWFTPEVVAAILATGVMVVIWRVRARTIRRGGPEEL